MKRGNWEIRDLPEMPFTLLIQKTDVSLIQHTRAVTRTALKIAEVLIKEYGKRVAINRDHLLAGAILHDVGKLFEYRREAGKFVKSRRESSSAPDLRAAFAAERGLRPRSSTSSPPTPRRATAPGGRSKRSSSTTPTL